MAVLLARACCLDAAQRFCRVVDEVRHFFRPRRWMGEEVSLAERRAHFLQRVAE